MGDKYDWKKIIQMVAIIGILCLFVGVFTRIMQKNQTSLLDYAKNNPSATLATSGDQKTGNSESEEVGEPETSGKEEPETSVKDKPESSDKNNDYADSFYYTDLEEGYKFHILYYNSMKEVCTAEIVASPEDPYNALEICYDLFKAEHIFEDVSKLQEFFDKL